MKRSNMSKETRQRAPKRSAVQMEQPERCSGKATETSPSKGPMGSALKKQLQSKILSKMKSSGLDEVTVDFTPKPVHPMTRKEKEQERRRKEINRKSAMSSRQRVKEERALNEMTLKEERSRKDELTRLENEKTGEKVRLLHILTSSFGLSQSMIQQTLSTITSENKLLDSNNGVVDEDKESVFYLQRMELNDTNSDTSCSTERVQESPLYYEENESFRLQCSEEVVIGSDVMSGSETMAGRDVMHENDVIGEESAHVSPETTGDYEFHIIEGGEYDLSNHDDNEHVTYVVYVQEPFLEGQNSSENSPEKSPEEATLTSVEKPSYINL